MHGNEILTTLAGYKETIGLILTGFAGSITHILNKMRKGERIPVRIQVYHHIVSGFVGYMVYLICGYLGISGGLVGVIIGITTYQATVIIEALEMFKAKQIYDFIIDFIMFKTGKGKK